MKILITGGTGLIGSQLAERLRQKGHDVAVLTRSKSSPENGLYYWDPNEGTIDDRAFPFFEHIVHLAGTGIADKRWTKKRKQLIISSRVDTLKFIRKIQAEHRIDIRAVVSASGVNAYGTETREKIFVEKDPFADDFLGECCRLWESAADAFHESRIVKLRTGLVIAKNDGAYPQISRPIRMGFGAALGSGKQWMPWIHIDDIVNMYIWALENKVSGSFNACTNDHVTNQKFIKTTARVLKKPLWLPNVPGFALKLVLGERAEIVLKGSRASAEKVLDAGFKFDFPKLKEAIQEVENKK